MTNSNCGKHYTLVSQAKIIKDRSQKFIASALSCPKTGHDALAKHLDSRLAGL
jgi:hypothetical protein